MSQQVEIVAVQPVILALAELRLFPSEVPTKIRGLFDVVYLWLRTANVQQIGHNYAIYDQCTNGGMQMRAGFPVSARFPDDESVKCVEFEAGRAAHIRHIGPYSKLNISYTNLVSWCAQEGYQTSGQSWEVYGDWHDDPSKLITDIYFRLQCLPT
ncbi:MAG: GyrI-like domain-containing protein [Blastocatellia bacterium]